MVNLTSCTTLRIALVSGQLLFKKYVDDLYPMKLRKVKGAKLVLKYPLGRTYRIKTYKKTVDYDVPFDLSGCDIKKIEASDKLRTQFTKMNEQKFKTNYGRIKPFLLAFAVISSSLAFVNGNI
jgi:hypothetical protein